MECPEFKRQDDISIHALQQQLIDFREELRARDAEVKSQLEKMDKIQTTRHESNDTRFKALEKSWDRLNWGWKIFLGICGAGVAAIEGFVFVREHWK